MPITCAAISPAVRLRCSPFSVDAQNAQPIRQPACVETQTLLPYVCRMSTVSAVCPSANS